MDDLAKRFREFADEMKARHFGAIQRPPQPLTDDEMHASYAAANERLRKIYGTTKEGTVNAD